MALVLGSRLGPYEVLAPLGAGGMGEVYRARDPRLGRDVAIKVLPHTLATDRERLKRFEQEARLASSLNHPNIITIHDIGQIDQCHYIAMELVDGETLRAVLASGPLSTSRAIDVAAQIADGLAKAHGTGIVHRDLKPDNVMLTKDGFVKILDFGLGKLSLSFDSDESHIDTVELAAHVRTSPGMILGTVHYMAPEQAAGRNVDFRADQFAFGLLLYEMVTGCRAFQRPTSVQTMSAIIAEEPTPVAELNPGIPAHLQAVIERCLSKDPNERYGSTLDLARDVRMSGSSPGRELRPGASVRAGEVLPSIAVLPFANLSADKDNEYFSDGLAEEVLNVLTQVPGLRVVARASAFAFRGREHAIREISEKLRVRTVLHGSVRRADTRIRVTAQLIDASDGTQLWSERYDRELRDVFDVQDEIARAIVEKLKVKLSGTGVPPVAKRYTDNLEAHSLYLKGNFHLYRLTADDLRKGRDYLEQAVALEPAHAPAWVQLADYYIASAFFSQAAPVGLWPRAREAARHALTADPDLAEAHAVVGWAQAVSEFRWIEGLHRLDTALRLNPASARSHFWRTCVLNALGHAEQALEAVHRAVDIDPLSSLFRDVMADLFLAAGRYDQAIAHARQVLDFDPNYGNGLALLGEAYSLTGRHEEALALYQRARQQIAGENWHVGRLSWAFVRGGRRADAERFLADLEAKRQRQYVCPTAIAIAATALDDRERALTWMETALSELDPNLQYMIRRLYFQPLRSDPRYHHVLRRMNLD